jgi:site-specific DNA-methyltransferase (adenine-specific)
MNALFSSVKTDWATPWELFRALDSSHGPFTLDVCATAENTKCARYFSPEENGFAQTWDGVCWMNPPYGRTIGPWLIKAVAEVRKGHADRVVCLLPARTDTIWWHKLVMPYGIVHFLKGRVRFEGAKHCAPFPSVIVIFDTHSTQHFVSAGLAPQHRAA